MIKAIALAIIAAPSSLPAQPANDEFPVLRIVPRANPCAAAEDGEIVVCARPRDDERYRLAPSFRNRSRLGDRISGLPSASLDTQQVAECGIFQHQRRCDKAEMAEFGYGNGRNPISVIGRIVSEVADPEQ